MTAPRVQAETPQIAPPPTLDTSRLKGGAPTSNRYANTVPCNWVIMPDDKDDSLITASNTVTGEVFEGSQKAFGQHLRGF